MRQTLNALLAALAIAGVHANCTPLAQSYPSRPITMVVPFAAGGGTDTLGRIIAEGMKASLGQPVIVENLPGAAGSVALSRVSRAAPDGYTVVFGNWATHVVGPATRAAPYDVVKDFVPVSLVATQPLVIIANKRVPANDLQGLVAWLKANPDKATVGTAGSRERDARGRSLLPSQDRSSRTARAVSRRRNPIHAGSDRRTRQSGIYASVQRASACPRRARSRPMR